MTKRDYEAVAAAMRRSRPQSQDCKYSVTGLPARQMQWEHDCVCLAEKFNAGNPRFEREMFLRACGYFNF